MVDVVVLEWGSAPSRKYTPESAEYDPLTGRADVVVLERRSAPLLRSARWNQLSKLHWVGMIHSQTGAVVNKPVK